jgi:hypothetical protein
MEGVDKTNLHIMGIVKLMKPAVEGAGPGGREQGDVRVRVWGYWHTGRRVLSRATRHIGNYCLQPDDFGLVGAGRGGLHGHLALRSPTDSLVVSGVGVTERYGGVLAGSCCCLLRLLGRDQGWRLRVATRWRALAAPENGEEGSLILQVFQ